MLALLPFSTQRVERAVVYLRPFSANTGEHRDAVLHSDEVMPRR
jgi:hypothetical protein